MTCSVNVHLDGQMFQCVHLDGLKILYLVVCRMINEYFSFDHYDHS